MKAPATRSIFLGLVVVLSACSAQSNLSVQRGTGPDPHLPPPDDSLLPVVDIAPAIGWPSGVLPETAAELTVNAFAVGLEHPRWLYVLPNGDVLVAETNAPPDSSAISGLKGVVMQRAMKKAGAAVPSADRITLLRDTDGDGVAETRSVLLAGLRSPFGMALVDETLYVANTDALMAFPYKSGDTAIASPGRKLSDLPTGPGSLNHHWTRSLVASPDGRHLYVGVGANSNVAEGGMDKEANRAAVLQIDRSSGASRVYAAGLRNPVGLAWHPDSGALWAVVNERDELGNDLVPDYLVALRDGGFYGWPWSYYGDHRDDRVQPQQPDMVAKALVPDYALGPHVAPLGLTFSHAARLPSRFADGAFVGLHGSWNRKPPSGYAVIFVPFVEGRPQGSPETVLSGFLSADGDARGRPVGLAIDAHGALLVADDVGNAVWRVTGATVQRQPVQAHGKP